MQLISLLVLVVVSSLAFAESAFDNYFDKAKELFSAGQYEEAVSYFEKAAQEQPTNADPLNNIGVVYLKINQQQKAIDAFNLVKTTFPNDWHAYFMLAAIYSDSGDMSLALENYNRAKELGIQGNDWIGPYLAEFQSKKMNVEYVPVTENSTKNVMITLEGNPVVDDEAIRDTLQQLEKIEFMYKRRLFDHVDISLLRLENNQTLAKEKWVVSGVDGEKEYLVDYNFAPPPEAKVKMLITVHAAD